MQGGLFLVQHEIDHHAVGLGRIIQIHQTGVLGHDRTRVFGRNNEHGIVQVGTPVNFRSQRGDDRRSGRQLNELEGRAVFFGDSVQIVAQPQPDGVGLHVTVVLVQQIDPDIRKIGLLAPVIVADHAVEIHG